jgi:hypothetical protein
MVSGINVGSRNNSHIVYGRAAAVVGVALVWYAIWTATSNALVLGGFHYSFFPWALLTTTGITALVGWRFVDTVTQVYTGEADKIGDNPETPLGFPPPLFLALGIVVVVAVLTHRTTSPLPYIGGTAFAAFLIWQIAKRETSTHTISSIPTLWWQLTALFLLLVVLYYFSHRADGDDASYINMAIGAQRTAGAVYQFDTMIGDGPIPIWLPEYKFESFELLSAAISSVTRLEPITITHLVLPLPQLVLFTLVLMLTLVPLAGPGWLAAALLWIAFLFLNETTYGSWGIHSVIRLFQGKAFLVTVLVPLLTALTVRWFRKGQWIDLVGLGIGNICAIGFHISGLFVGPMAIAFVAAAFVAVRPLSRSVWLRLIALVPAIAYPAAMAGLMVLFQLAIPAPEIGTPGAIDSLNFVASYGLAGLTVLALLPLGGIGFIGTDFARTAIIYMPLTMVLIVNPITWQLINIFTGNTGYRIFWSLPAALISALAGLALLRRAGLRSERSLLAAAAFSLLGAIGWNAVTATAESGMKIHWHAPDLKVDRSVYDLARRLAARTVPGCRILAPEYVSTWLSTIPDAPYPVFVREIYLIEYRYTMPAVERALRETLRLVVDGPASVEPPSPSILAAFRIPIGTVAVREGAPSREAAASLADSLGLLGPTPEGELLVWSGHCKTEGSLLERNHNPESLPATKLRH